MHDDFLRQARRQPPAAFASQLKARLQRQGFAEPSRRRRNWGLWIVSLLIGGATLASATYLTVKYVALLSPSASEVRQAHPAPAPHLQAREQHDVASHTNHPDAPPNPEHWARESSTARLEQEIPVGGIHDSGHPSADSFFSDTTSGRGPGASTGSGRLKTPSVRIVTTPDLAALMKEISPQATYASPAQIEVVSADAALQALCAEASPHRPDIVIASRRISREELNLCNAHGVGRILEAPLGHLATVITGAKAGIPMQLSRDAILRALLKRIPSPEEPYRLIDNPYTHWNQIDRSLEARRIEVLGPARDSLEFMTFAASILDPACDQYSWIRTLQSTDRRTYEEICHTLREDGAYAQARWDNTFVRQRLWANPDIIAVIDYPFYSANSADLLGSLLTGPPPTRESIVDGSYLGARTLHFYVSRARHVGVPTVSSFVMEFLRRQEFARHSLLLPPDGNTDSRRPYRAAQLAEVTLE